MNSTAEGSVEKAGVHCSGLSDVSLSIRNMCCIYSVENIYFIAYLGRCEQVWEVC